MLLEKMSAGVTWEVNLEVNLSDPLHAGDIVRRSTLVLKPRADITTSSKQGYIIGPQKGFMSSKNFEKKYCVNGDKDVNTESYSRRICVLIYHRHNVKL